MSNQEAFYKIHRALSQIHWNDYKNRVLTAKDNPVLSEPTRDIFRDLSTVNNHYQDIFFFDDHWTHRPKITTLLRTHMINTSVTNNLQNSGFYKEDSTLTKLGQEYNHYIQSNPYHKDKPMPIENRNAVRNHILAQCANQYQEHYEHNDRYYEWMAGIMTFFGLTALTMSLVLLGIYVKHTMPSIWMYLILLVIVSVGSFLVGNVYGTYVNVKRLTNRLTHINKACDRRFKQYQKRHDEIEHQEDMSRARNHHETKKDLIKFLSVNDRWRQFMNDQQLVDETLDYQMFSKYAIS